MEPDGLNWYENGLHSCKIFLLVFPLEPFPDVTVHNAKTSLESNPLLISLATQVNYQERKK